MKIKYLLILLFLITPLFSEIENTLDLSKIGRALGFPADQLTIENYLETERSIYTNRSSAEIGNNRPPPFKPEKILQCYKITGKDPFTFLPIIITVVDQNTYESVEMKIAREKFLLISEKSMTEGGRLPYGNFNISDSDTGFFLIQEVRIPAVPVYGEENSLKNPHYTNNCPQTIMCNVSYLHVPNSNVDVRIAQYKSIEDYTRTFSLIRGGEKYFNRFGYMDTDDDGNQVGQPIERNEPFQKMIIEVFKALNLEVLESPMLNSFRKEQKIEKPNIAPEPRTIPQPLDAQKPEASPQERLLEVTMSEPEDYSWRWLVGLIALLLAMGFAMKRYFSKRAASR